MKKHLQNIFHPEQNIPTGRLLSSFAFVNVFYSSSFHVPVTRDKNIYSALNISVPFESVQKWAHSLGPIMEVVAKPLGGSFSVSGTCGVRDSEGGALRPSLAGGVS